jgi:hypothetical protein
MQATSQPGYGWIVSRLAAIIEQALGIIRYVAFPSLTQLVLRLALAVPFWKSGILKWDGFLRLNDTAITLFSDEFKLHLPGGPYNYPAPACNGLPLRLRRDWISGVARARPRNAICRDGSPFHDAHRGADCTRWLAYSYYMGGDGACHHGLGTGTALGRSVC